ncbi:MAG: 4-(cytidine 5'-diphospho)-2-C-methyl-D-erythritol kinase [Clostridia bacterium]|nr:4-(cytidine 5'-diphospho)-2-C-methyl-D-erythritol kinase [Clostridia bacterium]
MTDCITVKAPAKLNLFLEVGERMEDGYHKIESVMQSVTLYDTLTVKKEKSGIAFNCDKKDLLYDGNLVVIAAKMFFEKSKAAGGVSITLQKKIPVSAGLGGGSSDAAATLTSLNRLYDFPLSEKDLFDIAKKLGADVPFCIKRGLCRAYGIGEVLQRIKPLPPCCFAVAKGAASVSTKAAFALMDAHKDRVIKNSDKITEMILKGDIKGVCDAMYNAFEINGEYDEKIKNVMKKHKAYNALMSGSGPSVFGVFEREEDAKNAENELRSLGCECFVCVPETDPEG